MNKKYLLIGLAIFGLLIVGVGLVFLNSDNTDIAIGKAVVDEALNTNTITNSNIETIDVPVGSTVFGGNSSTSITFSTLNESVMDIKLSKSQFKTLIDKSFLYNTFENYSISTTNEPFQVKAKLLRTELNYLNNTIYTYEARELIL